MNQVISNYAQAFFDLAKENNAVSTYKKELDDVLKTLLKVDNIKEFFISVNISKEEKKKILDESFKGKVDKNVLNFLKLLVDKNRFEYFKEIIKEFHHLCNDELKIKEGIIEVPRHLDSKDIKKLEEVLSKDCKVELQEKINKTLISGFKIIFDDQVIDNSMKEKINQMNNALMKGDSSWN